MAVYSKIKRQLTYLFTAHLGKTKTFGILFSKFTFLHARYYQNNQFKISVFKFIRLLRTKDFYRQTTTSQLKKLGRLKYT